MLCLVSAWGVQSVGAVLAGRLELANCRGLWQGGKVKEGFPNIDSHSGGCLGSDSGDSKCSSLPGPGAGEALCSCRLQYPWVVSAAGCSISNTQRDLSKHCPSSPEAWGGATSSSPPQDLICGLRGAASLQGQLEVGGPQVCGGVWERRWCCLAPRSLLPRPAPCRGFVQNTQALTRFLCSGKETAACIFQVWAGNLCLQAVLSSLITHSGHLSQL